MISKIHPLCPTDFQTQAINATHCRTCVIAGPGSGKTTTIVERIQTLLERGVHPLRIVVITFTNAAANQLIERLGLANQGKAPELQYVGTIHGYMLKVLQATGPTIGLPQTLSVMDEKAADDFLVDTIADLKMKGKCSKSDAKKEIARGPAVYWQDPPTAPTAAQRVALEYLSRMRVYGILDFDTILAAGVEVLKKQPECFTAADHFLWDEFQDSGDEDWKILNRIQVDNVFIVGDPDQCQPSGTLVLTDKGELPIEMLRSDMTVKAYDRQSQKIVGGNRIKIASRFYKGRLMKVESGAYKTECTPNHKWLVRWSDRRTAVCVTYLMYRQGLGFRVGWCQLFQHDKKRKSHSLHFFARCRLEKADYGWILSVHQNRAEASMMESIYAGKYGIPTVCFEPVEQSKFLTADYIRRIFREVSSRHHSAESLLKSCGRDIDSPLYWKNPKRSRTTFLTVEACNLLSGLMMVPTVHESWVPITVTAEEGEFPVWSLDVEKHHSYIANGLVTLNSIYAFRGAKPEKMADYFKRADQWLVIPLEHNFRSCVEVCDAANNLIDHNQKRFPKFTISHEKDRGIVRSQLFHAESDEVAWIAKSINSMRVPEENAVLLRTNNLVSKYLLLLKGLGVKVDYIDRQSRPADWGKCMRLLSLLANPNNDVLAFTYLRAKLEDGRKADEIRREAARNMTTINRLKFKFPMGLKASDLYLVLSVEQISVESIELVQRGVKELHEKASLPELIYLLGTELFHGDSKEQGVHVGTIHSAKGLEWDNVFLPAFEEGIIPSGAKSADIEEERRLAFVAITRARDQVWITHCATRPPQWGRGRPEPANPSRFIAEALPPIHS